MAEVFLAHYAKKKEQDGMPVPRFGDIQTYQSVAWKDRETIPEEFRIELPSKEVAEIWEKEDGAMKLEEELNRR